MNRVDLISIQMEMEFGSQGCHKLKQLVNNVLDNGEWQDGFEVAVKRGDLDSYECAELLDTVRKAYPDITLNVEKLKSLIEQYLPQAQVTPISWLVSEEGSLIITDSLRVSRISDDSLIWVTKRISWDGIILNKITNNEIEGTWYCPVDSQAEWKPLKLSFSDGTILEGQEIKF